jgi:hypothetical protein
MVRPTELLYGYMIRLTELTRAGCQTIFGITAIPIAAMVIAINAMAMTEI